MAEKIGRIPEFQGKYFFLSNFYQREIELDGVIWPSTEHYYQASKTLEYEWAEKIRTSKTPGESKKLGRKAPIRPDWEERKVEIMKKAVKAKFSQHHDLKMKLLKTGEDYLIEGNTWGDVIWGVDLRTGKGQNLLGLVLMEVREELRKERSHYPDVQDIDF